jgi:hypothetical protein
MKKVFLMIAVIAATTFTAFAFTAQANQNAVISTEVTNDEYVQVEFKDLSADTQILLLKVFEGYEMKTIYQNTENQLLKVVVVKDEEEKTFIQTEEGNFVEQE